MTSPRPPAAGPGTAAGAGPGALGRAGLELAPRWGLSAHARRLLTLALAGLVIALITRRPEFAGLAAPAVLLLAPWRRDYPQLVTVRVRLGAARVFEGEGLPVEVTVSGQGRYDVDVLLRAHESVEADPLPVRAEGGRAALAVAVTRWGHRPVGVCEIILRDRWRLTEGRLLVALPAVDCFPEPGDQHTRILLSRLPNWMGEHPARVTGEGVEFGGVREYVPGDRQRRINWPATTRRGGRLQVNTFAAERSQDVVLLVDASTEAGPAGSSTLDLALRGAVAATRAYLKSSDRVGFITYQWGVRWLAPGHGDRQFFRIAEGIVAQSEARARGYGLELLPRAAIPPGAMILVFSPLLDQRFVERLRELRERGHWMLVVDVLNDEPTAGKGTIGRLGHRIWRMEQEAIRFSLNELGIGVVHWDGQESLDLPLAPYTRRAQITRPRAGAMR
jgi:uncharacterized protein (DUF58 family)